MPKVVGLLRYSVSHFFKLYANIFMPMITNLPLFSLPTSYFHHKSGYVITSYRIVSAL